MGTTRSIKPIAYVIALVLVLNDVLGRGPLEMPLAKRIAIETFMFDGADEALSVGIAEAVRLDHEYR